MARLRGPWNTSLNFISLQISRVTNLYFIPYIGYTGGRIFLAVLAKFFINMAFSGIYVWSTELFPTFIRYLVHTHAESDRHLSVKPPFTSLSI